MARSASHNRAAVVGAGTDKPAVVLNKPVHLGYSGIGNRAIHNGAIPVIGSAATDFGIQSHRVIVQIISSGCAIRAQQGWNVVVLSVRARQSLKYRVLHHRAFCEVAVMAAQALGDVAIRSGRVQTWQGFSPTARGIAELEGRPNQRAEGLAP